MQNEGGKRIDGTKAESRWSRRRRDFFQRITGGWLALAFWLAGLLAVSAATRGPWDLSRLSEVPEASWGARTGLVQEVYYRGEPLNGNPTRVFGYLGRPRGDGQSGAKTEKSPGMVLVHGGGGKAFREWAEHWARRGYVALAMDLAGKGPGGPLPDGGPDQADSLKFREFRAADVKDMWSYHAVSAVVLGHSLLRSLPEVDATRTGITGISWGGYLTCIVAGVDPRFQVAVPVYGCGYLGENSAWKDGSLARMSADARSLWLETFDPSRYLSGVRSPILFLNGTTDFAYPLDSYRKSYGEVRPRYRNVSVVVDLPHGHIWTFPEVDAFVDAELRSGARVAKVGETKVVGETVTARVASRVGLREAKLCYTTDTGPWQKRAWRTVPGKIRGRRIEAELPGGRPLVGFLAVVDERGLRTSGEHFEIVP